MASDTARSNTLPLLGAEAAAGVGTEVTVAVGTAAAAETATAATATEPPGVSQEADDMAVDMWSVSLEGQCSRARTGRPVVLVEHGQHSRCLCAVDFY